MIAIIMDSHYVVSVLMNTIFYNIINDKLFYVN